MKPRARRPTLEDEALTNYDITAAQKWDGHAPGRIEYRFAPMPINIICAVQPMLTGLELRVYNDLWLHARWRRAPHYSPDPRLYRDPRRMSVRRIAARVGSGSGSYTAVSRAIDVLRSAGLVAVERPGDREHGSRGATYAVQVPALSPQFPRHSAGPAERREELRMKERSMVEFAERRLAALGRKKRNADNDDAKEEDTA